MGSPMRLADVHADSRFVREGFPFDEQSDAAYGTVVFVIGRQRRKTKGQLFRSLVAVPLQFFQVLFLGGIGRFHRFDILDG